MGVFTEQVQRLATEQEIIRREREEKRELKKKQEEAEKDLYYKIENIFTLTSFTTKNILKKFENKKSIYNFLTEYDTKNYLIEKTTKNVDVQYFLDKKYLSIVKKIYTPYKEQEKEKEKEEKEKQKEEKEKIKQEQRLQKHKKNKNKIPSTTEVIIEMIKCTCLILFIPILFFGMIFYYLLKGTGKRK